MTQDIQTKQEQAFAPFGKLPPNATEFDVLTAFNASLHEAFKPRVATNPATYQDKGDAL